MRTPAELPRRMPRTSRRFRLGVLIAIVVVIVVLTTVRDLASFYTSYLWFQEVHFTSVFRGVLVTKVALGASFCVIFFAIMLASLTLADRRAPLVLPPAATGEGDELVDRWRAVVAPHGLAVRLVTSVVFALFAGIGTNHEWNNWDLFIYHVDFGVQDPQFHHDIGFYVFQLPFVRFVIGWTFEALIVVLLVTVVAQYLNGGIRFQGQGPRVTSAVKIHVSVLLGLLSIVQGVNYYFDRLLLVLSTSHLVDGATATSVHANAPADYLLMGIAVVAAGLFLFNIRARGWSLPIVGVAVWALVWIVVGNVYPALYQALKVSPSELTREAPYLARNISATRAAYGLDNVKTVPEFDATANSVLAPADIAGPTPDAAANRQTLANVPLLDSNQVLNTFDKFQSKRSYYSINRLSIDRYNLPVNNGAPQMTETLAGMRELNGNVPSGFTTQHLQYTHGYGGVVAPAAQAGVDPNGNPVFSLSDIPPTGAPVVGQTDKGAQIYYGEGADSNGFVIADTKQQELNYQNVSGAEATTRYAGSGGVPAGGLLRRAAFALSFGNPDILLSGQVSASSRIIYNRNVTSRVEKAAPFLKYDSSPYSVVLNGQTYWILDAYTTTANYPYAQDANTSRVPGNSGLSGTFNYVRNSVKVVVNAYTGQMSFFVVDPKDPIIRVYEKAFPDLFKSGSTAEKVIPGITSHWRYPEDLFKVQTNMYGRYHLTNVTAFYNQANAWNISEDPGSGRPGTGNQTSSISANGTLTFSAKKLDPQYEVAHLPGQTQQEFLIDQPFVPYAGGSSSPQNQNLTAVMFASADPGDYGQLSVYTTPPNETVDGPQLVQSTIYNNSAISSELTLLNQQGTQVLLGEVVTVPVANTLLFVQPVYVQSSTNQVPSLKDVIVVYNGFAYHSSNSSLDAALCQITNPDGSTKPFAMYCGTAASQRPITKVANGGSGSQTGGATTTTTTAPPSSSSTTTPSTVVPPARESTVKQLLADANQAFAAASAALKSGDFATFGRDFAQAQADVARANAVASGSATTATTGPPPTTTTAPSSTTTTGRPTTTTTTRRG